MIKRGKDKKIFKIGTHNGIFHCDELVAIAVIRLALSHLKDLKIEIVRSEDIEVLNGCDIVIDIGSGKYDHHGKDFKMCRQTGEKYASAGLVWRSYGEKAIQNVAEEMGVYPEIQDLKEFNNEIDQQIIIPIDLEDNGVQFSEHTFSFITKLRPTWLELQDFDTAFLKAEAMVFDIFKGIIKAKVAKMKSSPYLKKRLESLKCMDGIFELPAQTIEWEETMVNYNLKNNYAIKFVIFPYPRGGWAAQSVPPSMEERFKQLVPFPEEWAGEKKRLPQISGVMDAILCHNDRFFIRAKSKKSIIEMCKIAMSNQS